jgi:hypothetical protein
MTGTETIAEFHRVPWIRTVLMVNGSAANRAAFIAGYNDQRRPPKPATAAKWHAWELGQTVRRVLCDTDGSPEGPDPQGLDGEAATAGAEGIAPTSPPSPRNSKT